MQCNAMKHRREEQESVIFTQQSRIHTKNQQRNIGRQKLNMFHLTNELKHREKTDFALRQRGQ